jgi:hypothetical protein
LEDSSSHICPVSTLGCQDFNIEVFLSFFQDLAYYIQSSDKKSISFLSV